MKANIHIWSYLDQFSLEWEMFLTKVLEKMNHILFSVTFFFENGAFYEIMWKNIVEPDSPQMTQWGMRISRCLRYLRPQIHTQIM
jgi:hypothetical protein